MNKKNISDFLINSKKILNLFYLVLIFSAIFFTTRILKDISFFDYVYTFFKLIFPLFLGIFISWILYPVTVFLQKKGISKVLSISIVYFFIIIFIIVFISVIIPALIVQASDFLKIIPNIINEILSRVFLVFGNNDINIEIRRMVYSYFVETTNILPSYIFDFFNIFIYRTASILIGIIIGYYLLFDVEKIKSNLNKYIPIKIKPDFIEVLKLGNDSLLKYFRGALLIASIVFIFSYIVLLIIKVNNPLILALICGVTNLIPYIGPFIGGSLVAAVGFTQSFQIGLLGILFISLLQTLESFILQPLVMSKAMKLKPLSILLGLLIFGHYFGLIGMIFATPIVFTLINVYKFLSEKYRGKLWKF